MTTILTAIHTSTLQLRSLDISDNPIFKEDDYEMDVEEFVESLVVFVEKSVELRSLNISRLGLKNHIVQIVNQINANETLEMVDFSGNDLDPLDVQYILNLMNINTKIYLYPQSIMYKQDFFFRKAFNKFRISHFDENTKNDDSFEAMSEEENIFDPLVNKVINRNIME